ncbi:hypothetical protein SEA_ZUKO_91 [Streptomyces phage Zuko]|uniref:Uncharacterized protein n=1 Tax=Streptomyces phage Zuko TaxID=2601695 RepID=A0A5J6D793_9CAUD|nr:hypothetical protein PP630_gp091 [Streptomyces phage Zuko]QEQ93669.1 hypothetical protein SEA_ZUKO_91 [Streptomyces phage Zuko]
MSKIQSHENCTHPATKAGRAKCRRSRAKFADAFSAALTDGTAIETPAPVFESVRVTKETWREHKDDAVRIWTQIDDETESEIATGVKITGWGKQWVNYEDAEGKTRRASVTCVRVATVEA